MKSESINTVYNSAFWSIILKDTSGTYHIIQNKRSDF